MVKSMSAAGAGTQSQGEGKKKKEEMPRKRGGTFVSRTCRQRHRVRKNAEVASQPRPFERLKKKKKKKACGGGSTTITTTEKDKSASSRLIVLSEILPRQSPLFVGDPKLSQVNPHERKIATTTITTTFTTPHGVHLEDGEGVVFAGVPLRIRRLPPRLQGLDIAVVVVTRHDHGAPGGRCQLAQQLKRVCVLRREKRIVTVRGKIEKSLGVSRGRGNECILVATRKQ